MRFALTLQQRDFFYKNHFIEFEGLFSREQASLIDKAAQEVMSLRLQVPVSKWEILEPLAIYKAGYDLWRNSELIKKATQKLSIIEIASQLFDASPLHIAFDQLCIANPARAPFNRSLSLTEISSIKPLAGSILFLLSDPVHDEKPDENLEFPLPKAIGSALFIAPAFPIPWPQLFSMKDLQFLLVAFAPKKSRYCQEPNDPHSPLFKKRGYVFNDQLNETFHPVVFGKK